MFRLEGLFVLFKVIDIGYLGGSWKLGAGGMSGQIITDCLCFIFSLEI